MVRNILLFAAALTAACATPVELTSHHATTAAICGWEDAAVDAVVFSDTLELSDACRAAIADDLKVDHEAFAANDPRLEDTLQAAATLATVDLGTVDELTAGQNVDAAFVAKLRGIAAETGESNVNAVLYDWLASSVSTTEPAHDLEHGSASYTMPTRVLEVDEFTHRLTGAALLVHEIRHGDQTWHVPCDTDETLECDAEAGGAYAFQLAYTSLALDRAEDGASVEWLVGQVAFFTARIAH